MISVRRGAHLPSLWLRPPEELLKAKRVSRWRRGGECLGQRAQRVQRPGGRNAIQVTAKRIQENKKIFLNSFIEI